MRGRRPRKMPLRSEIRLPNFAGTLEKAQADVQNNLADSTNQLRSADRQEHGPNQRRLKNRSQRSIVRIAILIEQRKDEPGSFEVADGRISWVNQNGTVWINLGSADSLRRQVTFSVFDADQHDAAKAAKKGSIEVTRLSDEHMAEARITKDDPTNPILVGDNIYSQVWHRGKQLHFALTGVIDIDGDGQSDMQLARELIKLNGGIVDAYLKDDGKIEGEITANTRYLILGDVPDSALKSALTEGYHKMSKEAASVGVQTITLPQFLDQMGYKPQDRTIHLGTGAKARDFPRGRIIPMDPRVRHRVRLDDLRPQLRRQRRLNLLSTVDFSRTACDAISLALWLMAAVPAAGLSYRNIPVRQTAWPGVSGRVRLPIVSAVGGSTDSICGPCKGRRISAAGDHSQNRGGGVWKAFAK